MTDSIVRTAVQVDDDNIIRKQVMNKTDDNIIRHQVMGIEESTPTIESLSVTENGTYNATEGVDGFNPVVVNVPSSLPDEELISEFDFVYNKTNNLSAYTDKINGEQSTQSERSIELDDDGYMQFNNTNGYLWIPQYFSYQKDYKIEIEIVGKESYVSGDGENIFKFGFGDNHIIMQWNLADSNWKMADWSGHDIRLDEPFDYFNNKKVTIYFGCAIVDGVLTHNSYYNNTFTMYIGDTLVYHWEQSKSVTGNDNIALIGLGHNTACKNYKFKSVKIYKLNNVTRGE